MKQLPIDEVLPQLLAALRSHVNAVLVAEPGAGKTTRVPLALLEEPWLQGKKIVMLEPRRLAARSAAHFMAAGLGEAAGQTVGYRVRLDTKVSAATRIEVVTEGVLTRMLQEDQALEQVGAIIFDEFHERHLHGDLGLALSLQSQALLREDLRIVVMSATLAAEPLAALLGGAPVVRSAGRVYPVATHYAASRRTGPLEQVMGLAIVNALREHDGDVLAFLPGVAEIRRTASWLATAGLPNTTRIEELHGSLPLDKQDAAIAKSAPGTRKVVLATSIAESSLTVEGVTIVVDSGLMRVPRFSPRTGMTRLDTVAVSQASADQRRGRAGRLAPGHCYRLWTEQEQPYLPEQSAPELLEADLAPLALELAIWGITDPVELDWLTAPPGPAWEQAVAILQQLHALDGDGKPTELGRRIAGFGVHPRLGAMMISGASLGAARTACELAALLSERDMLPQERNVDMQLRLELLRQLADGRSSHPQAGAASRVMAQARQWERLLPAHRAGGQTRIPPLGVLLAIAYPDRIAWRREDGRYLLANGRGATLAEAQPLSLSSLLVACELDDAGTESRIRLAAELKLVDIEPYLNEYVRSEATLEWDEAAQAMRARNRLRLGAILLKETPRQNVDEEQAAELLLTIIRRDGFDMLPMTKQAAQLKARMGLMSLSGDGNWPDASDAGLLAAAAEWLKPHLYGIRSRAGLQKLPMTTLLESLLTYRQRQELDEQVPTHIVVPSGSRIPVDYSNPAAPALAVRLQELFGMRETPRLAGGKLPVTLHLLSPSQRPVQVTSDLQSFWEHAYFEVKKDLKGRYPKHYWPDDPYAAVATNRAKPRPPR
jgi:ATP-dependent helicase HrpB